MVVSEFPNQSPLSLLIIQATCVICLLSSTYQKKSVVEVRATEDYFNKTLHQGHLSGLRADCGCMLYRPFCIFASEVVGVGGGAQVKGQAFGYEHIH